MDDYRTPGARVFATRNMKGKTIFLFGRGTYDGYKEIEQDDVFFMGLNMKGRENPRITLDNGEIVWGCESWWGPEDTLDTLIERGAEVVEVSIHDYRKEAKEAAEEGNDD